MGPNPKVVAVGLTGNGKSTLCNRLYGGNGFEESDSADGATQTTVTKYGTFRVGCASQNLTVIDTPGLGDREDKDSAHIRQMLEVIRSVQAVDVFFIVINYQSPRIDINTKRLIQLLPAMLPGKNFWKHVIVVFSKTYRPMAKDADIRKRLIEYKKKFNDEFRVQLEDIQFAFVDSKDDTNNVENSAQFRNMFEFIRNVGPFQTAHAQAVEGDLEFQSVAKHEHEMNELRQQIPKDKSEVITPPA